MSWLYQPLLPGGAQLQADSGGGAPGGGSDGSEGIDISIAIVVALLMILSGQHLEHWLLQLLLMADKV